MSEWDIFGICYYSMVPAMICWASLMYFAARRHQVNLTLLDRYDPGSLGLMIFFSVLIWPLAALLLIIDSIKLNNELTNERTY